MKDETLLPDAELIKRLKAIWWGSGDCHYMSNDTASKIIAACRAALQSGNSCQTEPVSQHYKLPPNSFTDDDLEGMAHGDNPVANAYRELLEFRRNAAGGDSKQPVTVPVAYFYPGDESECKSVSLPEELDDEQKANCIPLVPIHKVPDGWIPVSERMPDNKPGCFEYIVFDSLNNRAHHDYWNVPEPGDDAFTPFWNHYGQYVTHWQPLPDAPKVTP